MHVLYNSVDVHIEFRVIFYNRFVGVERQVVQDNVLVWLYV